MSKVNNFFENYYQKESKNYYANIKDLLDSSKFIF